MPVATAYLGIILIWSTTPLALQWSIQGMNFSFSALARLSIGLVAAVILMLLGRISFPQHPKARKAYLVGGAGLFASLTLTYWAARDIHSGLIAVVFGLSPLMSSVMAAFLLGEKSLTFSKLFGTLLGVSGLAVIFLSGETRGSSPFLISLSILLLAVFFYSACLVWLKRIGDSSPPLATTVGTLAVATLLFSLLCLFTGDQIPASIPLRSGIAIIYLGVLGSAIAFTMYYYVIKNLPATRVSLITLITPVLALLFGNWLNGESITPSIGFGTGLILLGLAAHQREALVSMLRDHWPIKP